MVSVPSSGLPTWLSHLGDLGERSQNDAGLIHDADAFGGTGAGSERAANPDGAFVEMGKKFRADHPAEHQEASQREAGKRSADRNPAMLDGPTDSLAIAVNQKGHDGVVPFLNAFAKSDAA